MMKLLLLKLVSLSLKLYYSFSAKKNKILLSGVNVFKLKIKGTGNQFKASNCLKYSTILIQGNNNTVELSGSEIMNTHFLIKGDNITVLLQEVTSIRNTSIKILDNNSSLLIKNGTGIGKGSELIVAGTDNYIEIGSNCMIADNVNIWASDTHSILNSDNKRINNDKPITIKDRVWIGKSGTILKGVSIGADSVIAFSSVVTKDVPSNSIAAGTPSIVIKKKIHWIKERV